MAGDLGDTIQRFINSPPGQMTAGGVLAGIVWKFFERVESLLTDATKFEVAVWLLGVRVGQKLDAWPSTFAKLFDRVFGTRHFTLRCFLRCSFASLTATVLMWLVHLGIRPTRPSTTPSSLYQTIYDLTSIMVANIIPDYFAYFLTRLSLKAMINHGKWSPVVLALDAIGAGWLASIGFTAAFFLYGFGMADWHFGKFLIHVYDDAIRTPFYPLEIITGARLVIYIFPALFTTVWLWLYLGSGFLLQAFRYFDIGFDWLSRKLDIEKKPLQSMGFVAGTLIAMLYWGFAIVVRTAAK